MTNPKQRPLFNLEAIPQEKIMPRHHWYYVTSPRNMDMVAGVANDGSPIMADHDTRSPVAIKPHLFNTRRLAELYRDKWVRGGHVNKWLYSRP